MDVKNAIQEIRKSSTFRLVLGTLLAIGNFLNGCEVCCTLVLSIVHVHACAEVCGIISWDIPFRLFSLHINGNHLGIQNIISLWAQDGMQK